ncbi:lymphatic vessel endothelial hyaluronic receptor 1b isoform X1 [Takifugu rubripes]|uniref:lymphatic vessel endothelial hyaluronic receptor 1b isoform X1 n=1 Tax=Takifugu rubripes TaxID=31033 RepID=UPI0011455C0E|nr:lymphatic vessel endothelial hyaluronic acid receptor 1-like isoform X1 [Takifugu rubripes]
MARVQLFLHLLLLFAPNLLHPVKARPQSPGAAGVFLLPEGGEYSFSLSDAGAACLQLNATIASRAQVERALQLGLETCRFGWTADRIAVVPRLTADTKCGKGRTGVVPWATSEDQKFAVFCFDASDLEFSSDRPTAPPRSATDSSTLTSLLQTSTATEPPLTSWTGPPPPRTSTAPVAPPTQAFTLLLQAATSTSGKASSTRHPTSASQPTTSSAALVSSAFSTSVQQNLSMFSTNAPKASLADLPTALIILASILMLLVVAAVLWCYKVSWPKGQPDDCVETEMWKHSDSEVDLSRAQEEESDRKCLGDITLGMDPESRMTLE